MRWIGAALVATVMGLIIWAVQSIPQSIPPGTVPIVITTPRPTSHADRNALLTKIVRSACPRAFTRAALMNGGGQTEIGFSWEVVRSGPGFRVLAVECPARKWPIDVTVRYS